MSISREEVLHISGLARLRLTAEEVETFAGQLSSIIGHVETLGELDCRNVEPTFHILPLSNVMRDDVPSGGCLDREDALKNAPDATGKFYRVPRIIE